MSNGFMGKVLFIDLTSGEIEEETLSDNTCRDFVGGYGIGARILYSRQKRGVDALGADNILGFVTGPLTGTQAIGGSRYVIVGKSPLTGTWGDANSGGTFGPVLKFSGFDAVFFSGISPRPVYLLIDNGKVQLMDAGYLWGKDTFETEDILKSESGKELEVTCIGQAGEKMSLISSVMNNKGRAAGRSGLGAVMGSKKLKAVAVKGKMKVPVFDLVKTAELRRKYIPLLTGPYEFFKSFGTAGSVVRAAEIGDSPVKNWEGVASIDFPNMKQLDIDEIMKRLSKKYACYMCPVGCGGVMKAGVGEYKCEAGAHKPEYETLSMFGTNCLNDNIDSIIKTNDICNRYGLDTISTGSTIAMTIECYENGLITRKDTDGLEMTWGNHKSIVAMTEKIAKREGFGAILADGSRIAAQRIGEGADQFAMQIKGQDFPAHDGKFLYDFATAYRMDATPGRHTHCGAFHPPGLPIPQYDPKASSGRGLVQKIGVCFNHAVNAAGMCQFVADTFPDANIFIEFINSITGWNWTMDEMLRAGERVANIRHVFNIREGLNPLQYKIPNRIVGLPPKKDGPSAGITLDEETLDREFCEAMEWDTRTTKPSKKKLMEIGVDDISLE